MSRMQKFEEPQFGHPWTTIKLSQLVRFKLLLRDISLRNFFLNGVRFDLRESVDIPFLNKLGMWMDNLCSEDGQRVYDKKDCCVVSQQQKDRFSWYTFLFAQISYIRTAVLGHSRLSLKCKLPNQFSRFWPVLLQSWNVGMCNVTQLRKRFTGPRGHDFARGLSNLYAKSLWRTFSRLKNPKMQWHAEAQTDALSLTENASLDNSSRHDIVATSPVVLRWLCDSPGTGCARITSSAEYSNSYS